MKISHIFAEIQGNPNNIKAYRQLIEHYKSCELTDQADAFSHLLKVKYGLDDPNIDRSKQEKS